MSRLVVCFAFDSDSPFCLVNIAVNFLFLVTDDLFFN